MSSSSKKSNTTTTSTSSNSTSSRSSLFSLGCICKDAKSVSVSESRPRDPPPTRDTSVEFYSSLLLEDPDDTPSFSGLLRELDDLEKTVLSLPTTKRSSSIDECVAVVKETDDPLGDFRKSMLQMIVEKEIITADELRDLLEQFLSLNSPDHHDVILRAFADIWNEVFSGLESGKQRRAGRRK